MATSMEMTATRMATTANYSGKGKGCSGGGGDNDDDKHDDDHVREYC